jgi:molybdopterin-guanine dinucleotide biosynthesis protein A
VIWTEHFTPDAEGAEGEATCEDGQNLPFHALAGALIAQAAQKFLETGKKESWQLTPSSLIRIA